MNNINEEFVKYCLGYVKNNLNTTEKRNDFSKKIDDIKLKLEKKIEEKEQEMKIEYINDTFIFSKDIPEIKFDEKQLETLLLSNKLKKDKKTKKKTKRKNNKKKKNNRRK